MLGQVPGEAVVAAAVLGRTVQHQHDAPRFGGHDAPVRHLDAVGVLEGPLVHAMVSCQMTRESWPSQ